MGNNKVQNELVKRTILLGVMAGMRSMSGPAAITRRAAKQPAGFKGTVFSPLASQQVAALATLSSVGELILDKLPILPKRTAFLPITGRAVLGGLAGAAAYTESKQPVLPGAGIAALSAVVSSHIFFRLRMGVRKLLHLPDLPVALMEDGLVLAFGREFERTYD